MGVRLPRGALSVVDGIAWEVVCRSCGGAHGGVGRAPGLRRWRLLVFLLKEIGDLVLNDTNNRFS